MTKFGLTILTMKIWNFGDGHGQNWPDHFDHRTSFFDQTVKKSWSLDPPLIFQLKGTRHLHSLSIDYSSLTKLSALHSLCGHP
jgi:hypothetical protein